MMFICNKNTNKIGARCRILVGLIVCPWSTGRHCGNDCRIEQEDLNGLLPILAKMEKNKRLSIAENVDVVAFEASQCHAPRD